MKQYQRRRLNKISLEILSGLAQGGFIVAMFALPNLGLIMKLFKADNKTKQQKVRRAIEALRKYDLIDVSPSSNNTEMNIRLSRAGKELLEMENLVLPIGKKWDGKWRVIMFDIPEPYARARRALSLKLRELGCYHYQNSVFVYPFECKKDVEFIQKYFGYEKGIKYLVATVLDDSEKLERFFKL